MARKDEAKANDAIVTVNIDDFTRTRDSVLVSLTQLQSAVAELSRAYINHANTVLGRHQSEFDVGAIANITQSLHENGLLPSMGMVPRAVSPGAQSEAGDKKKRKRRAPDPNAPKRALTPFFLYMKHNRSKIAEELGETAKPKQVSDEGTRRWAEMPEDEKDTYKKLYAENLAVYKENMKKYKAGQPFSDDVRAANQLQQDVETAEVTNDSDVEEEEEDEESPEPPREPTPPRNTKRRRSEVKTPKTPTLTAETKTPSDAKKASPEKKSSPKKRGPKAAVQKDETPASTTKRTKKKRKSEVEA